MKNAAASKFISNLINLAEAKRKLDWDFCKALHTAYHTEVDLGHSVVPLWKFADSTSWNEFVTEKLKISVKRAEKYISVYMAFQDHEGSASQVELQKLELALPIVNNYNISKVLDDATNLTRKEFRETIAEEKPEIYFQINVKSSDRHIVEQAYAIANAQFPECQNVKLLLLTKIFETYIEQNTQRSLPRPRRGSAKHA